MLGPRGAARAACRRSDGGADWGAMRSEARRGMAGTADERVPIAPQQVDAPLTRSAVFLVLVTLGLVALTVYAGRKGEAA